jgi:hypothetical protein
LAYLYDREDKVTHQQNHTTPLPETTVAGGAGDGGSSGPSLELLENKNL